MDWYELLPLILNMSLTASVIILAVMILRLLLKRAPKVYAYMLWAAVLFRLLCPVAVSAPLSILGLFDTPVVKTSDSVSQVAYIPNNIVHTESPVVTLPVPVLDNVINNALPRGEEQLAADPLEAPISILTCIWLTGILIMTGYSVVSYIRLRKSMAGALRVRDNIYAADNIATPFVLGIFRPRIYLLSSLGKQEQEYILKHEQYHIRRGDHIFKLLAYAALCIHWFNPLVWVAFLLFAKDMEMSCDEAVIKKLGEEVRADYAASLLNMAAGGSTVPGMPLAFGEADTKGRIKNLAAWKKPAFGVTIGAILLCIAGIVICISNPREGVIAIKMPETTEDVNIADETEAEQIDFAAAEVGIEYIAEPKLDSLDTAILNAIVEHNASSYPAGAYHCASFVELKQELLMIDSAPPSPAVLTVYGMAFEQAFSYSQGKLNQVSGSHMPVAITFEMSDNTYTVTDFWIPGDGSYYVSDIRDKFPDEIEEDALDTQKYVVAQIQECYSRAIQHYEIDTEAVIEELFDMIESSPANASNPADYIDAHSLEYRELTYYGTYSLNYVFDKFIEGEQTGLRGQLMRILLDDLAPEAKLRLYAETGQEYFDEWANCAVQVLEQHDMDWIKENQPAMWIYSHVQ